MDVKDKFSTSNFHSVEWGEATWNDKEKSVRNRYDTVQGKFNKAGSSEIPWKDFKIIIRESISRNHFDNKELGEFLDEISTKLKKI